MSFLEAMASGLCVVALDAPTMNEVISHGVNGLLYAPGRRAPLDFGLAREMGARAREDVVRGRARWEARLPETLEFLTTPTATLRERGARLALPLPTEARLAVVPPPTPGGLAGLLATVEAEWLLFLPHGHTLLAPEALKEMLAQLPCGTVAVLGHHLQVLTDGSEALCRVAAPLAAWTRLLEGETMPEAPAGMPVPAATLLHRDLLRQAGAEAPASAAALAALLLPALAAEAGVVVRDAVVARLPMLTAAQAKAERAAWLAIAKVSGVTIAKRNIVAPPRLAALAARLALSSVALLDRVSPRLGWAAEAGLRATQRWRRRHAATP